MIAELFVFSGGQAGAQRVRSMNSCRSPVERLSVDRGRAANPSFGVGWQLRGVSSNLRYSTRRERDELRVHQPDLGRPDATRAALIPIFKTDAWWDLAQDERRATFEKDSRDTEIGFSYLLAIARRLHHSRDLGEPFDLLTWFEYVPDDEPLFDALLLRLRGTREWEFVEREVDIRLERA